MAKLLALHLLLKKQQYTPVYTNMWNYKCAKNTNSLAAKTAVLVDLMGNICKGKGKAVPLQAWGGPEGSRMLR
jgi:hypothetical protein